MPFDLNQMRMLRRVSILYTPFNSITCGCALRLPCLKFLQIQRNYVSVLPKLITPALRYIDVSFNSLTNFGIDDDTFTGAPLLEKVDVSNNRLKEVPRIFLHAVINVNLNSNLITTLDGFEQRLDPTRLETLSLSDNRITTLPVALAAFQKMKSLTIRGTRSHRVPETLIDWLRGLDELELAGRNPLDLSKRDYNVYEGRPLTLAYLMN